MQPLESSCRLAKAVVTLDSRGGSSPGPHMRHSLPQSHQFYVTAPQPCPYLPGKVERKLFTALQGEGARASQRRALAPGVPALAERALPAVLRGMLGLPLGPDRGRRDFCPAPASSGRCGATRTWSASPRSPWATEEQYDLFRSYLDARHAAGGMADMDMSEFAAMIEETPVRSRVIEYYRRPGPGAARLVAVCLTDILADGVSMVYSFFDPALPRESLGSFVILDHVASPPRGGCLTSTSATGCRAAPRWTTRPRFQPLEIFTEATGAALGRPTRPRPRAGAHRPAISEQVAAIESLHQVTPGTLPRASLLDFIRPRRHKAGAKRRRRQQRPVSARADLQGRHLMERRQFLRGAAVVRLRPPASPPPPSRRSAPPGAWSPPGRATSPASASARSGSPTVSR